jgi:hypothetical protein
MNFIRRIFQLDADQKGAFTYISVGISIIIVLSLLYFGLLGSFGVGASYNALARNARWAGFWWKVPGSILLLGTLWFDQQVFTYNLKPKINETVQAIIVLASIALIIFVNCGFRFDHF